MFDVSSVSLDSTFTIDTFYFLKARGVSASVGNLSTGSSSSTQSEDRKKDGRPVKRRAASPEPNISVNVSPERASMAIDDSAVRFVSNKFFSLSIIDFIGL